MAYGSALAAAGIALVSALVAWARLLDSADSDSSFPALASGPLLGVALPLAAIGAAIGVCWLLRRLGRLKPDLPDEADQADFSAASRARRSSTSLLGGRPRRGRSSSSSRSIFG